MHTAYRIALAACACAWLLPAADSLAQSAAPVLTGAADPGAKVPATTYQPSIGYRPEAGAGTPPDRNWVASNATVAAYNSMSLTMKMKGMQAPADPHAGHAAPAATTAPAEHAGHAMHGAPAHHADAAARPAAPPAESP
ncbi:hypothetical protein [Herbaspirillum sp. SJZ107]|uniref:hypothetical protein n=1 Tax=Herbaspirillum sp. SJZ107 TaxID=2572881 RepID=UPI00114ECF5A|nr:hypothetical protein [Herbaspirillum sp. SJZ107]TQK11050.1 hypothetical protein FBX97_0982 [Herbaspirillum sp. SJZ107]